jgi:ketosteroid isomerase-like protein
MDRNEQIIRKAYEVAEVQDIKGFAALFAEDAIIRDEAKLKEYRGANLGAS